ncbi:MAG TPA: N-acetyltransferase [Firmicutes bacterium]|nr:N-acetyltransferase [Bacillota bacterium]
MKRLLLRNGEELIVRQAMPEDAPHIIAYIDQISTETGYLTFGSGEFGVTVEQEGDFIEGLLESDNKLMILAFIESKLVGQLTFMGGSRPRIKHTGELGLSVLQEYWRQGIGTELIKYLLAWARDTRIIRKVNLRVRSDNMGAIRLYESLGFVYEGTITRQFYIDGAFFDSIHMGMEIG